LLACSTVTESNEFLEWLAARALLKRHGVLRGALLYQTKAPSQLFNVCQFALPDDFNRPSQRRQGFGLLRVPSNIPQELPPPKDFPGFWSVRVRATLVPVPEASINKHNRFPLGENNIRMARKVSGMQSKTIPFAMQERAHKQFRSRVL
jgi:hypothetical protein